MGKINLIEIDTKYSKKNITINQMDTNDYKLYTPEIVEKYKNSFKTILNITDDKTKTKFILYDKVQKWYKSQEIKNLKMERIYIKTKLGSCTSGGCGIGASLFAGLTVTGVFYYMDNFIKRLSPFFLATYTILILIFGVKVLCSEDDKVEMYNMFLEVLNNLEDDKNDKRG